MRRIAIASLLVAAAATTAHAQSPINAVAGDQSWIDEHGHAPTADEDLLERERIRTHLAWVERRLRAADTEHLSADLRARRAALLDALASYRAKGVFPRNEAHPGRRPRFIDDEGRTCAVGHLIEISAGRALAEAIDAAHEYDYLLEMRDPRLDVWVARSGFAAKELAMIQPSYGFLPPEMQPQPEMPIMNPVEPIARPVMTRPHLRRLLAAAEAEVQMCVAQHSPARRVRVGVRFGPRGLKVLASSRSRALDGCVREALRRRVLRTGMAAPRRAITARHLYRRSRAPRVGPPAVLPVPVLPGLQSAS